MIRASIITPNGFKKEFETTKITITSTDGERGILPNHMPVTFMLDIGKMETVENGEKCTYAIAGGVFYFENNEATILVNSFESKEDIDLNRAIASRDRQVAKLNSKDINIDMKRAQISLQRALNRIKIAG
ncbi:MAG: ATP synthase F1 subunit epsilon [Erysipelotrichaceae bacterium]|nr:ATP synthase F1 subunit epsilon [Erysipelotrichaceae bacterium]